ncbi:MAG: TIGR01777 family oxidoreductase [Gemmataceae bacterium]|nr:TIGR01777 family oxidoreductase [Gemmataceae bacterium]
MRVFVSGGTGLIGNVLVPRLLDRGDAVAVLSRRPEHAKQLWGARVEVVGGDPMLAGPWSDAAAGCDAVVNLAGEGIFKRRWNADFKQLIRDSRVKSTDNVVAALAKHPRRADGTAKTLVNASAIGYYGPRGDEELTEDAAPGDDFMAKACVEWEQAARAVEQYGVRVALIRTGIVLAKAGGALEKMLTPFKMFVGGPVASGRQYMSWIHIDDEVGVILLALDNANVGGPMNATAPNPVTNREFSKALGRVLHRPSFMKAPGFGLRVMLGEVANVVTTGQRVVPRAALQAGYQFKFTEVESALRDVLQK